MDEQLEFGNMGNAGQAAPSLKVLKETPVKRCMESGITALSLHELISAVVGNPDTALRVLGKFPTLNDLMRATTYELSSIKGMGDAKTVALKAALDLGRRAIFESQAEQKTISSPAQAYDAVRDMAYLEQEQMRVILLDTRMHIIAIHTIYQGSTNTTMVRPCELFRDAIRANSVCIIIAHNHPSGDPSPSPEDVCITKDIVATGKVVGIEVSDHIVVGQNRFVSLKERGLGFNG